MLTATADTGWFVLNIKNRVAKSGPLRGQRHPYVYQLVLALQHMGWRWIETYIWAKPNCDPRSLRAAHQGRLRVRLRVRQGARPTSTSTPSASPTRRPPSEIARRNLDENGRRNTDAGFGRDRTKTYAHGRR